MSDIFTDLVSSDVCIGNIIKVSKHSELKLSIFSDRIGNCQSFQCVRYFSESQNHELSILAIYLVIFQS